MGYTGHIVEVSGEDYPPVLGRTPWSVPHPFILDMQAAAAFGYAPVTTYDITAVVTAAPPRADKLKGIRELAVNLASGKVHR